MPWRDDFIIPLEPISDPEGERIRVRLNILRGVVVDFVVQYETPVVEQTDDHFVVVRYDASHQRAHRDLLDRRGRSIRKTWLAEHLTFSEAVSLAIAEIKQNWRRYRQDFFLGSQE